MSTVTFPNATTRALENAGGLICGEVAGEQSAKEEQPVIRSE